MRQACTILCLLIVVTLLQADDKKPAEVKNPALRTELLQRVKEDQAARHAMIQQSQQEKVDQAASQKILEKLLKLDADNTAWLKKHVNQHGFPTISEVGKDGANGAWLLVQHADAQPAFQRQCLDLMTKLPRHERDGKNLAYLTDRVLLAEGKKQLYGTQFIKDAEGWKPKPIEDEANVDQRRADVGLSTLAEYAKQLSAMYDKKK
ncbi:MAG TPA: hypothetical protein PLX97_13435 [Gemmatales bacterium]|nr:hypothetical protein [Gemmatales bacterium]